MQEPGSLEDWAKYQFGDIALLPWLNEKKKRFLAVVFKLSRFPFHGRDVDFPPQLAKERTGSVRDFLLYWLKRLAWLLLWTSSRVRWKHRFLAWPIEWKLWDWYCRRQHIW